MASKRGKRNKRIKGRRRSTEKPTSRSAKSSSAPGSKPTRNLGVWVMTAIAVVIVIVAVAKIAGDGADTNDSDSDSSRVRPERLTVRVLNRYHHDPSAFTQGLLWHDGHLFESTGLRSRSTLRMVDLPTGEVRRSRRLENRLFAEGLARVDELLVQLSWEAGEALVWNRDDFTLVRTLEYEGEGWGLCYDGEHLVMSDGSDRLQFRDPTSFSVVRTVRVRRNGAPLRDLNELECVEGSVWANVWKADEIVRIDPDSGHVTAVVDASGLLQRTRRDERVLNGIAWIPERKHFAITGKNWPYLFEVVFEPLE